MRSAALVALLLGAWVYGTPAHAANKMIECNACSTAEHMRLVAIDHGNGEHYVFSLRHQLILAVSVWYDHELRRHFAFTHAPGAPMEQAFALMLDANEIKPGILAGQQVIRGDISNIGGGSHDPVKISLNGEHGSAYGSFINFAHQCLGSQTCATGIDSALGKIAGAESVLNGLGFSILGSGGNVSWEGLPPHFKLWLCNSNNDCALLQYNNERGWHYVESRSEGGYGNRYPRYGERLSYDFDNSGEAGMFERGLRGGGAHVSGQYNSTRTVLACVITDGSKSCEYVTIME